MAKEITRDGLWEGEVTIGMTPTIFLNQFHYPAQGQRAFNGQYEILAARANSILNSLGEILRDFEQDLMANYTHKHRMGPWK